MTILCGTDFSPGSRAATRVAMALARRMGDRLLLVHAREPLPRVMAPESMVGAYDLVLEEAEALEGTLKEEVRNLEPKQVEIETRVVPTTATRALLSSIDEDTRMVVVGSHGRGPTARMLLGSVADRLVRTSTRPVLVVRRNADALLEWMNDERSLEAMVGIDLDDTSVGAVSWARTLRAIGPVNFVFAHAFIISEAYLRYGMRDLQHPTETDPEVWRAVEREARELIGDLPGRGESDVVLRSVWGSPAREVAELAAKMHPHLLVVGTHGRSGLARLWYGSFAEELLHETRTSLLCVPRAAEVAASSEVPQLSTALVASDLGPHGARALGHAYGLLSGRGGVVHLLHVCRPGQDPEACLRQLQASVPADVPPGVVTRFHVVSGDDVGLAIAHTAERLGPALVVLSVGERWQGLGTTVSKVAKNTGAAVVLVHRHPA